MNEARQPLANGAEDAAAGERSKCWNEYRTRGTTVRQVDESSHGQRKPAQGREKRRSPPPWHARHRGASRTAGTVGGDGFTHSRFPFQGIRVCADRHGDLEPQNSLKTISSSTRSAMAVSSRSSAFRIPSEPMPAQHTPHRRERGGRDRGQEPVRQKSAGCIAPENGPSRYCVLRP